MESLQGVIMAAYGHNHQTAAHQSQQLPFTRTERHHHASVLTHTAWAGWDYEADTEAADYGVEKSADE
jgi:hypothetical protein